MRCVEGIRQLDLFGSCLHIDSSFMFELILGKKGLISLIRAQRIPSYHIVQVPLDIITSRLAYLNWIKDSIDDFPFTLNWI